MRDEPQWAPLPVGWETHPAGSIAGDLMEVAFDPLRHDLALVWERRLDERIAGAIVTEGWQPLAVTDDSQIWSRDRADAAGRKLARVPQPRERAMEVGR